MSKLPKLSSKKVLSALLRADFLYTIKRVAMSIWGMSQKLTCGWLYPCIQGNFHQKLWNQLSISLVWVKHNLSSCCDNREGCRNSSKNFPAPWMRQKPTFSAQASASTSPASLLRPIKADVSGRSRKARTRVPPFWLNFRWRRNFPRKHSHILKNVRMLNEQKDVGKTSERKSGRIMPWIIKLKYHVGWGAEFYF